MNSLSNPYGDPVAGRRTPHRVVRLMILTYCVTLLFGACTGTALATPGPPFSCHGALDASFYNPPADVPSVVPGTVVSCRPVVLGFASNPPGNHAWQILYESQDLNGSPMTVSGTLIVPTAAWTGPSSRPVVTLAPGSQGLGNQCAFSKQLTSSPVLESSELFAFLQAGFAVVITDYQGYLNGQVPTYMVGRPEGHAVLDAARAAEGFPLAGLARWAPVAIVGYSQGGQGSLWAAQLASSYAPDLHVVGAVAGGVPGSLVQTAEALNGGLAAGFLLDATVGMHAAYPQLPFASLINPAGDAALITLGQECFVSTLATNLGRNLSSYTVGGLTLDQILPLAGADGLTWSEALGQSTLGVGISAQSVPFPVYMYRGIIDEIIPTSTEDATHAAYCHAGVRVQWKVYWGDHILTLFEAVGDVTSYLTARFDAWPAPTNC